MRGQSRNSSVPGKQFIHPFLPNICEFLKTEFTGNGVENLFQGNFVDRVDLFDGRMPSELIWDPLKIATHPSRIKGRRIYCVLAKTINQIRGLHRMEDLTQKTKYFLCLYEDMHVPLINYIDMLVEKQISHLDLISYTEYGTEPILIPEFRIYGTCKKTFIQRIMKHKSYERFDKLIDAKKFILTDEYLCTQINLTGGVIQPPAVRLQPEMKLFEEDEAFHEGMLPDVLRYVINCNFFSETKKNHPLVHLISKSLPQRCTIRNLSDILHEYSRKHDYVYDFVLSCMRCSMLGLYKNSHTRPPFHIRKVLIDVFKNKTKNEFLQWMLMDHQQLLFYIIKEFLVFACRLVPSLYNEIIRRYSWSKFEEGVMTAMNAVRKYEFWDKSNPLLFSNVESMLASVNKQQIHHLYRPIKTSFAHAVMSECLRIDEERCMTKSNTVIKREWKETMYKLAIRIKDKTMPFYLLECFHVSQQTINTISQIQEMFLEEGSKSSLKQFLYTLPRNEFEALRDFADAFDRKHNVRIFDLPCHTYINQCIALRRKHRIKNGVAIPDHVGDVMVCLNCKTFKSFINHCDNKGNVCNLYAYGFQKVLVEDDCEDNTIKTYCGKRCDKSDGKKRHNYSSQYSSFLHLTDDQLKRNNNDRQRKREAKEMRKENENIICSNTELVRVNLLGRILQFYGKLYTICPSCGNAFAYSGKYFNGQKGFYCGCCLSAQGELFTTIACSHCLAIKNNESWQPITVRGENDDNQRQQIYLCNNCYKPWIRDSTRLLKVSTINKGLKEKWKRLKHPSNN